jgi:3-phenylpropionate/trans-cinnamate dioxygenase ferredoxin component
MEFIMAANADEIPEGTMKSFIVQGKDIVIVNYKNNFYALDKKCTHMGGDLSKGRLEGPVIICPLHGSRFDITSGKCIQGPKIGIIKLKTGDTKVYPVKSENGKIQIAV